MKKEPLLEIGMNLEVIEAGCDEAGRGCLAGPVFAAAVVLPPDFNSDVLNDSKKLTSKIRNELRPVIEDQALSFAVAMCTPEEIDKLNILWASVEAMHKALRKLTVDPGHILVDGNRFIQYENVPHTCVVGGDAKYMSIAVLAALDSVFGGIRAFMEDGFDNTIFISGFVVNTILAAGLAYLGDLLGVELYLAAVVVFGARIFQNLGIIRRYLLKKY